MDSALFSSFLPQTQHGFSDNNSPVMSTAPSVASDGLSVMSGLTAPVPPYLTTALPSPEYISQASAIRLATDWQRSRKSSVSDDQDQDVSPDEDKSGVADNAVALINAFLDKVLYDILATARSTRLDALRPAVKDTLKKSLARDAIASADANLEDLLALEDEDDEERPRTSASAASRFNLEFVWKRSRLRVMMRSEKSDFDIDDDERYVQEEGLLTGERRWSQASGVISLLSEIFLAGVLDHLAEQLVSSAVLYAAVRARRESKARPISGSWTTYQVVVEEPDVEKGALNSPMDRLWRNWRKSLRHQSMRGGGTRYSNSNASSPAFTRRGSEGWPDGQLARTLDEEDLRTPTGLAHSQRDIVPNPEHEYPEHILASNIPLPLGVRDVDEIEVPGLAVDPDAKLDDIPTPELRRASVAPLSIRKVRDLDDTEALRPPGDGPLNRPHIPRRRSSSVPSPIVHRHALQTQATDFGTRHFRPENGTSSQERSAQSIDQEVEPPQKNTFALNIEPQSDSNNTMSEPTVTASGTVHVDPSAIKSSEGHAVEESTQRDTPFSAPFSAAEVASRVLSSGIMPNSQVSDEQRETEARAGPGEKMSAAMLSQQQNLYGAPRQSSESFSLGMPKSPISRTPSRGSPADKARNRGAVIVGAPSGISLSPGIAPVNLYSQRSSSRDLGSPQARNARSGSRSSQLQESRPASPHSDSGESDLVKTPREFLASRKLSSTRVPYPVSPTSLPKQKPRTPIKIDTSRANNFDSVSDHIPSPVSPRDGRFASLLLQRQASISQERAAERVTPRSSPPQPQEEFAPARSSPKRLDWPTKLIPVESAGSDGTESRRGSVRRIGVERNGSIVSNISLNKGRGNKPMTSASITSAEDFDALVQGTDTIKFSLTPESVRAGAVESSASSIHSLHKRSISGEDLFRPGRMFTRTSIDNGRGSLDTSRKGSKISLNHSNVVPNIPEEARGRKASTVTRPRSLSRPAVRNKSATRNGQIPREPTVQTDSTRDFSDFIRTTGPDKEPQTLVPALTNRSTTSLHSVKSMSSLRSAADGRNRSVSGQSVRPGESIPPVPAMPQDPSRANRSNLKPRDARTAATEGVSDLADLIRNGPASQTGNRIPRSVAPFRTTMDSEELSELTGQLNASGFDPDSYPLDTSIRPNRDIHNPSVSSSVGPRSTASDQATINTMNSRAALLPKDTSSKPIATTQPAYSSQPPPLSASRGSAGLPNPAPEKRKYRNKDPYAIDFSDDEDDDNGLLTALPTQKPRGDGGDLSTFLQNSNTSKPNSPALGSTHSTKSPPLNGREYQAPPTAGQNGTSPYEPSIAESSRTNNSTTTMRPAIIRSQISAGNSIPQVRFTNKPKYEVRSAGGGPRMNALASSGTNDLADFLKNSGPPDEVPRRPRAPSGAAAPAPVVGGGGASGKGGSGGKVEVKKGPKFWQRKRYLDMP